MNVAKANELCRRLDDAANGAAGRSFTLAGNPSPAGVLADAAVHAIRFPSGCTPHDAALLASSQDAEWFRQIAFDAGLSFPTVPVIAAAVSLLAHGASA